MTIVPIYNEEGLKIDSLKINDDITFVNGRVQKGSKGYYKGIGVPYTHHSVLEVKDKTLYDKVQKSNVFYLGYSVAKKVYKNKTGIFREKYQPFFTDFIGGCGIKEGMIVLNSTIFEKSSVDVIDCIQYDLENQHSYYIIDYRCNRKHYLTDNGNPYQLRDLVDYMLESDWNFLWDKTTINDITPDGRVSDVADLFHSKELVHKLGSVYSLLYSMARLDIEKYNQFLKTNNLFHNDDKSFIFNSLELLKLNNIDIDVFLPHNDVYDNYKYIVLNYLLVGKNVAHCACDMYAQQGDIVKDKYIEIVSKQFMGK